MSIEIQTDRLYSRLFRHRFDPNDVHPGWEFLDSTFKKVDFKAAIYQLLGEGKIVRTGYYATSVRGFHRHVILWRNRKGKT